MTPLLSVLLGVGQPGLTLVGESLPPSTDRLAASFDRQPTLISLRASSDRAELFADFAEGLSLPDWFGHNLDAAHEALHDQLATAPDTLIVVHAPEIHADRRAAQQLIAVINDVLVERTECGVLVAPTDFGNRSS